jgi:DNA-directed RNA polymerase specialized sigma24 family protein
MGRGGLDLSGKHPVNGAMKGGGPDSEAGLGRREFVTTHWSLVLSVRDGGTSGEAALEELCRTYWPPLFAYARRDGLSLHDAQDAVQGFIGNLLARRDLHGVQPELGRFRTFLLVSFRNFLVSRSRSENRVKRGGDFAMVSLEDEGAVGWLERELSDGMTPERAYDRAWARQVMRCALARLEAEHRTPQQVRLFEALQSTLVDGGRVRGESELAAALKMSTGALAVAATRMRRRYRAMIEDEVRRTLADPADLEAELRSLWEAWG